MAKTVNQTVSHWMVVSVENIQSQFVETWLERRVRSAPQKVLYIRHSLLDKYSHRTPPEEGTQGQSAGCTMVTTCIISSRFMFDTNTHAMIPPVVVVPSSMVI